MKSSEDVRIFSLVVLAEGKINRLLRVPEVVGPLRGIHDGAWRQSGSTFS